MGTKQYIVKGITFSGSTNQLDFLSPLKNWLNNLEVGDRRLAHRLCHFIPTQCPFERKLNLFGHTILSVPPSLQAQSPL